MFKYINLIVQDVVVDGSGIRLGVRLTTRVTICYIFNLFVTGKTNFRGRFVR